MKQGHDSETFDLEDVIVWPCSTWCYRYELHEFSHKSDDYRVLLVGSEEYKDFHNLELTERRVFLQVGGFVTEYKHSVSNEG